MKTQKILLSGFRRRLGTSNGRSATTIALSFLAICSLDSANCQQLFLEKTFSVQTTTDVKYGVGTINITTTPAERDLLLDIYEPEGAEVPALKPGFILVHGGAWRFGSKESDRFENPSRPGDYNSAVSEYAMEFAKRGYFCAVINYRQIQDDPGVRGVLGMPPADISGLAESIRAIFAPEFPLDQVRRGIEAGFDDTVQAIKWLVENADGYAVDPSRIAAGGWSAGGQNALLAGYVEGSPVRVLWVNSAGTGGEMMDAFLQEPSQPPAIFFQGDMDTVASVERTRTIVARLGSIGIPYHYSEMTGEDHFYLRTHPVSSTGETVEDLIALFFFEKMDLGIRIHSAADILEVNWFGGRLQSADSLDGMWSDIGSATSPHIIEASGTQRFFRLRPQ